MTAKASATFRRRLRAAGVSLWEERNMAIKAARLPAWTHCVLLDQPRTSLDEEETPFPVATLYGSESFCHGQAGTVYTLDEVAKALEVDEVIARERATFLTETQSANG